MLLISFLLLLTYIYAKGFKKFTTDIKMNMQYNIITLRIKVCKTTRNL
mgnify:CR=1 FL=1